MSSISATDPISRAWQRMVRVCFRPFELGKWFTLGFAAFLVVIGEGSLTFQYSDPRGFSRLGGLGNMIRNNLGIAAAIAGSALLVLLGLGLLFSWLHCRARFVFVHQLAYNRSEVSAPWSRWREQGDSYFLARTLVMLLAFAFTIVGFLTVGVLVWTGGSAGNILAIVAGVLFALVLLVAWGVTIFVLDELVMPVMFATTSRVAPAWQLVRTQILEPHLSQVALFLLLRIAFRVATGFVVLASLCFTCCLAAIPYIGTVITLPVYVFLQSYSLYFVEQFAPELRIFSNVGQPTVCYACRFDLRGAPGAARCPECGAHLTPQFWAQAYAEDPNLRGPSSPGQAPPTF